VLALEERLAAFQGTEAALVLGSGYLANVGVIPALVGPEDAVVCDRLDHASMWDGVRLSGARLYRYRHLDVDDLERALQRAAERGARRTLIVTETVFSMDGDIAPLQAIVELKERYGAALLIDEAHAEGTFGPSGEGVARALGVSDRVDLHLGTFGKAFGVYGAYVAGRRFWIEHLVNSARSFVFSTALPPAVIAGVGAALDVVASAHDLRRELHRKSAHFRTALADLGLDICGSQSHIVPLVVGASENALALSQALEERGVLAVAIRPPTVANGSARLRFSLTAAHLDSDLEMALEAIRDVVAAAGLHARS
jgi:8-amino-7-oxononanoate synthase